MKFINISGPRNDIDRVTDLYLSRYEIQLESALSELKTVDNLRPFVEINPYKDALGKAEEFAGYLENADEITPDTSLGLDDIFELIRTTNEAYLKIQSKKETLKKETETLLNKQKLIEPFRPLDGELDRILHYKYINYRFGRIPVEQYGRLEKYLMDDLGAIFVKGEQDESYLYGVYFVSPGEAQKVDAVFRSLHFEKITIPDEYTGTPADAYQKLNRQITEVSRKINDLNQEAADMLAQKAPQIVASKQRLEELAHNFDVRKMAARMEDQKEDYYILCGWMSEMMSHALWKKSKTMIKYLLSWKKIGILTLENLRSSCRIQSCSNHLKCLLACMDFPPTTRSTRPSLLPSHTLLFSESCSGTWGRDCSC